MPSWIKKLGGERAAAALYYSEPNGAEATGVEWKDLPPADKDMWYSRAYQRKQDQDNTQDPNK